MASIVLNHIKKHYGKSDSNAVKDFNLHIDDKEFIVLVGPSGCGKSTTLRMIAGLEDISEGDIYIDNNRVNKLAPKDRDIAMVFQSYALYPYMTVYENIGFGLKMRKFKKQEIDERVRHAAKILGLEPYLKRKPKDLSGGQRQRVALGRAIVRNPKVFLMDEPLSNLDAKLRIQMRSEIIKLHRRLNTTTIYVTHDQVEAMTMADRIVIMKDGEIQQVGTPEEIYNQPANIFVGSFIGYPGMNFIPAKFSEGSILIENSRFNLLDEEIKLLTKHHYQDKSLIVAIRPEDIHMASAGTDSSFEALIEISELLGSESVLHTSIHHHDLLVKVFASNIKSNDKIDLQFDFTKMLFFDAETKKLIH
ncbi:sn-glycerol-3-phosphate ABC transporter ATP-binding protein UgpC [Sporolactobacillus shoreae]|uniref:sn-glycerol-3-phosphate ABC transporter ATP-binding protein UgpC n=1 Tax=Sporolactobacillus shoreae TaxID=1465501 RepID=A0A4Z0GMN7_9BACL|nr:sn-glycerol-3-phosphate ABC transporter ATP-binding protein UgpC [Sporolactobacillus shoreae]TGA98325.1 sn-glycerol-3-phosphate ABC transporter ATP-binding protein UgpC [Sporolactobacillus shoreae]